VTWTCGVTMTNKEHSRDFPSDHSRKLQWYQYTCFTGYGTNPPKKKGKGECCKIEDNMIICVT
jgi:hypothetical protein